jgi:gamma-D-glutamyl-L-lysine dipeptidyl-peptidase
MPYRKSRILQHILTILLVINLANCVHIKVRTPRHNIHDIVAKANTDFYLDHRIWYQDVYAEVSGDKIILKGEAFFELPVKGIAKKLQKAGYEQQLIDQVTYLPESFENDLNYGIITVPYTMGRYEPVAEKQEGTEMLYGEPVRLIKDADPYVQVQSSVGYLGYIPKSDLRMLSLNDWKAYHSNEFAIINENITLENGFELQIGTRLPYLGDDRFLLADGSEISLSPDNYKLVNAELNPLRQAIVTSGEQFLGLPYVWGGRSAEGLDCSGFVMQSYGMNNLYLPRDTDEMANVGRMIGFPGWTDAMLPGDLLFFAGSRRMVTHTAIYLGEGKVIHSLGSGVQIQSINPDDPDYAERLHKRFIFAKRFFD